MSIAAALLKQANAAVANNAQLYKLLQNWEQAGGSASAYPMSANSKVEPKALPPDLAAALAAHLKLPKGSEVDELDAAETMLNLEGSDFGAAKQPTKAAKVYEAAEAVDGMQPKKVFESHKKCTPGEFSMHKEGGQKRAKDVNTAAEANAYNKSMAIPGMLGGAGAGLGAGVGGLYGLLSSEKGKRLRSALRGAAGGALIGGGAGLGAGLGVRHAIPTMRDPSGADMVKWLVDKPENLNDNVHRSIYGMPEKDLNTQMGTGGVVGGLAGIGLGGLGAMGLAEATKDKDDDDKRDNEKKAVIGTTIGAVAGAAGAKPGKRVRESARGAAKGFGTDLGALVGGLSGGTLGFFGGGAATLPLLGVGAVPGGILGALGGGYAGGRVGYNIADKAIGPYKSKAEETQENLEQLLATYRKLKEIEGPQKSAALDFGRQVGVRVTK